MSTQALKAVATDGKSLTPAQQIKVKLDGLQKNIATAIPQTMQKFLTPERLTRLFWAEARKNPTLLKCDADSICSAMMTAAQLGIEIGVMGQGYIVPYWNNKKRGHEAQFIPGYKGLIALARRSGDVISIETHIVYEKDKFSLKLGLDSQVEHEPYLDGDRGGPKLVYGVARFRDGGHHFEWMAIGEVLKIMQRNASKNRDGDVIGPWITDTDQMIRKTIVRRMANYLPMSIEFANALVVDAAAAEGNRATIEGDFVAVDETGAPPAEDPPANDPPAADPADETQDPPAAEQKTAEPPEQEAWTVARALDRVHQQTDIELLDLFADSLPNEIKTDSLFTKGFKARRDELKKAAAKQ